jgi:quercetin dioxygenase-like cupin family protein
MTEVVGVVTRESAESGWVLGDRIRYMGSLAGTDLCIVEVEVPPGSGTPPHRHASPEIFSIIDGEVTFGLAAGSDGQSIVARLGSVVTVPARAVHNYRNYSDRTASMLVVVEKEMVAFFKDVQRSEPLAGPPRAEDVAVVMAACQRHGIEIMAAPPA